MGDITRAILGRQGMEKMAVEGGWAGSTGPALGVYKPRTFKENIQDQIVAHQNKITELQNVLDSMSPDVEKFVEALQKANL